MPRDADEKVGSSQGSQSGVTAGLAALTAKAKPVLAALAGGVPAADTLIVAVDEQGFPVAQRVLRRPRDLPGAVVVGRHNRCDVAVPADTRVSLRHLLLVASSGEGPQRFRGYDLGGRSGLVLADGQPVPGVSFHSQGLIVLGRAVVFVVPGGPEGVGLLTGDDGEVFQRLTGLDASGRGVRLAVSAVSEPGVAYLEPREPMEFGGYRGVDPQARPEPRGALRLRSTKPSKRGEESRELGVDSRQLQRGLLIGRYSDRCSLAGHGRNLSRVHALVAEEGPASLLVYDLASTNGVRPQGQTDGASHAVVRMTADAPAMLGHFELAWIPGGSSHLH